MNREQYLQKRNRHFEESAGICSMQSQVFEADYNCCTALRIGLPQPAVGANERAAYPFLRPDYPGASVAGR